MNIIKSTQKYLYNTKKLQNAKILQGGSQKQVNIFNTC